MEDSGELEIKALAEKFLAIPKEIRLTGKDGYIHIPAIPDKFYLSEVASWLSYAPEFAVDNHVERASDYVIESKGYAPVRSINFEINTSKAGSYLVPDQDEITSLQLFEPLNINQLNNTELITNDLLRCSYSHHRFLFIALRKLHENHTAFLEILAGKLNMPLRADQNYFGDVLNMLRKLNRQLLELEEKGLYNIIPMLFSIRDHGVIMSTDLNNVFKYEVEEWGLLYSYGFSYHTSCAVLVILKEFITLHIKLYETMLGKSPWEIPANAPTTIDDRKMVFIPTGTKEKVKLIAEILELKNNESEILEDISLNPFQLMLLLRTFQDKKFIRQKIDKYQLALAYEILTGGSSSYFEKQYRTDEIDAAKLKKWSKRTPYRKAIECVSELREKISSDIVPRLSEFENLK